MWHFGVVSPPLKLQSLTLSTALHAAANIHNGFTLFFVVSILAVSHCACKSIVSSRTLPGYYLPACFTERLREALRNPLCLLGVHHTLDPHRISRLAQRPPLLAHVCATHGSELPAEPTPKHLHRIQVGALRRQISEPHMFGLIGRLTNP